MGQEIRSLSLGCVVLAAGQSRRFQGSKLLSELGGVPLIRRALDAVPAERFRRVVVVTGYPEITRLAGEYGFSALPNSRPELGASRSVQLGLTALRDCDAVLFQVADQPLLRRETVATLLNFYLAHPDHIAALGCRGVRGNPCIFPARFYPELMALTGDRGGSAVIRRHQEDLMLWEVGAPALADADTPEALAALRGYVGA